MGKKPIEELVHDQAEPVELADEFEELEELPVRSVEPAKANAPGSIRAVDGDSYISIAHRFANGKAARELALKIQELNGGAPVRAGKLVRIPGGK